MRVPRVPKLRGRCNVGCGYEMLIWRVSRLRCPDRRASDNAKISTANLKDHQVLSDALGKSVATP